MDFFTTKGGVEFTSGVLQCLRRIANALDKIAEEREKSPRLDDDWGTICLECGGHPLVISGSWQKVNEGRMHFSPNAGGLYLNGRLMHLECLEVEKGKYGQLSVVVRGLGRDVADNRDLLSEIHQGDGPVGTITVCGGKMVVPFLLPGDE